MDVGADGFYIITVGLWVSGSYKPSTAKIRRISSVYSLRFKVTRDPVRDQTYRNRMKLQGDSAKTLKPNVGSSHLVREKVLECGK